jgi:hypothetical protein
MNTERMTVIALGICLGSSLIMSLSGAMNPVSANTNCAENDLNSQTIMTCGQTTTQSDDLSLPHTVSEDECTQNSNSDDNKILDMEDVECLSAFELDN